MARQKGMLNLSGNIEVNAGAPFDARDIVPTKADLTVAANFPYAYVGMETYVVAEDKKYRYMGGGVTTLSNWVEVGNGGGTAGHTIENASGTDMTARTNLQFKGGASVSDDSQNDRTIVECEQVQLSTMPTAAAGLAGKIVQYIGTSDANYTKGYYYQCVEDGGVYSWENITVQPVPNFDYSNEFGAENIMSLTEKMIGQWIDGKPLYQKTINCGTLPNAGDLLVDINVNNIEKVVGFNAICIDGVGQSIPIPNTICTKAEDIIYQINIFFNSSHKIRIVTGSNRTTYTGYVTIRYTKTTDSAMAIGTPNDYSTTEKIVGQWIDGKPVYQKTFDNLTCTTNDDNWVELCRISNLDKIIDADLYTNNPFIKYVPAEITKKSGTTDEIDVCGNGSNRTIVYATIRYTKTTD